MANATPRTLYRRKREPVPIAQEAGWATRPLWMCPENLASPGFESRTMQPVVSLDTDYAIPAALRYLYTEYYGFCTLHNSSSSLPVGRRGWGEEVLMYKDPNLQQQVIRQPTSLCKATNWMFAPISLWMLPSVAPLQHEKPCVCCHLFKAL